MSHKPYQSRYVGNKAINYAARLLNFAEGFELWRLDIKKWARLQAKEFFQKLLPKRDMVQPSLRLGERSYQSYATALADAIIVAMVYEQRCQDYVDAVGRLRELIEVEFAASVPDSADYGRFELLQEDVEHQEQRLRFLQQEANREKYQLLQLAYPDRHPEELPLSTYHLWHTFSIKEIDDTMREAMYLCESVHSEAEFAIQENPFCRDLSSVIYLIDSITEDGYLLAKERYKDRLEKSGAR